MRKLALLIFFVFCSVTLFSQSNATVVMPDLLTHFVNGYPPNTIIWLSYNNKFYKLEVQVDNTVNMSWVLANRSRYSPAGYLSLSDTVTIATKYDIDTLALRPYTETDPVWVADSSLYYKKAYIVSHFVPKTRTLSINGTAYDLSADRAWTITATETDPYSFHKADSNTVKNPVTYSYFNSHKGITSITAGKGLAGGTITTSGTIRADTSFLETKVHSILTYEPIIADGTTGQYLSWDKTWRTPAGVLYIAGYGMGLTGDTFYNARYQKSIDTVDVAKSGILVATSGVLGTIVNNSSNWDNSFVKSDSNIQKNPITLKYFNDHNTGVVYSGTTPILISGSVIAIAPDTLATWRAKQNKGVVAYNWGQWHDTLLTRIYQDWGTLVSGSAPNYTIKADTSKMVTFGDTAIVGGKIQSKYQYKLRNGDKNGQLPYWDVGLQMWIPSQHMSWNDTSDIFTTKNIYAGGTITANTNLIINSLKNILGNSYSDTTVVDSSGYLKRGLKAVYQYEIGSDAENNITVPFSLKSTTSVYYNGIAIPNTRWSGGGTTVLYVNLDTRKYDKIIIQR